MHLTRTATGAKWFTQVFGGTNEEQDVSYVAGLIHDLMRPPTENVDHTEISIREATNVLSKFTIPSDISQKILRCIEEHRIFHDIPIIQQSVFLSDKLLEQSGAYLIFRRSYYIGECVDFTDIPFEEAVVTYWKRRMEKFFPENFHLKVRDLAQYQFTFPQSFFHAFQTKAPWAQTLAREFYSYGRNKQINLDDLIESYKSTDPQIMVLQQEAKEYIHGMKYNQFQTLIHI